MKNLALPTMEERLFHDVTAAGPESWTQARRGRLLIANPLRDCPIILDINQHPSPASCYRLVPGTGCPDLAKHVISILGSLRVLVTVTVPPALPCVILWYQPRGAGIHFILWPPETHLVYKLH